MCSYVKEKVFVPPMPLDNDELKLRIAAAAETMDRNMFEGAGLQTGHLSRHKWSVH
jgi:hypothetical protein